MKEAGIKPEQVIVVSTKGDLPNYGDNYVSYGGTNWTSVYIEDGPGVGFYDPDMGLFPSHSVSIEGWLSGEKYNVRINGKLEEQRTLSEVYKQEIGK